jgi:DNA-directed RNA polymerase specialized sigma24 family protein
MTEEGSKDGAGAHDDPMSPPVSDIDAKLAEIRRTAQSLAAKMLGADDAEDIAQEIVIWAWEKLRAEPGSIDFSRPLTPVVFSWVGTRVLGVHAIPDARLARSVVYTDHRRNDIALHQDPIAALAGRELGRVVSESLRTMPAARREVYVAIHDRGESYADIALARGISTETVHAHNRLAQIAVRAAVSRYQDTGR